MWKAFGFFWLLIGFSAWIVYARNNSYHIILGGLKPCYNIWIIHFFCLFLEYVYDGTRPIWTLEPADYIYENNIGCAIHGKVTAFFIVVPSFLATLFALSKAQIYIRVRYPQWNTTFTNAVFIGVLPLMGYLISVGTGPTYKDDKKICMSQGIIDRLFLMIYLFYWVGVNLFMMIIFWLHVDLVDDSFPSLDHQIQLNRKWIPLLFATSFAVMATTIIAETRSIVRSDLMVYFGFMLHVLDQTFNNMLMFHTIFGHVPFLEEADKVRIGLELMVSQVEHMDDTAVVEIGLEVEEYSMGLYWLDLPGVNPVQMTHELVKEYDLWEFVVDNRRFLMQLNNIKNRDGGFMAQIYRSPHDVLRCFSHNNNIKIDWSGNRAYE